jgi:hypothetical protein
MGVIPSPSSISISFSLPHNNIFRMHKLPDTAAKCTGVCSDDCGNKVRGAISISRYDWSRDLLYMDDIISTRTLSFSICFHFSIFEFYDRVSFALKISPFYIETNSFLPKLVPRAYARKKRCDKLLVRRNEGSGDKIRFCFAIFNSILL